MTVVVVTVKNIFANLPEALDSEQFLTLFQNGSIKIERIASHSHRAPENFWYDAAEEEWVIVLRGTATLEFADGALVEMGAGDYLAIAPHVRHRVARTGVETIWLAVHVKPI
jgi:cupin 2 domain-containing protein